ncbi:lysozyme [Pontibaca salina]|uniref:Lysozyme n=1 Tax=Pontibaca salina TaxID=2795731 RepID=A0A934HMX6_9RHOB|nr:lysozyme [Pontibaca salina]MBI6628312.1 lysozyme [Pontibaca salina]
MRQFFAALIGLFRRPDPDKPKSQAKKGAVAGLALTIAFVSGWEGTRYVAYRDPVGIPTICEGITKGVQMGDTATRAQCDAMLTRELETHERGLDACLDPPTPLPVKTKVALVSWTYNVGVGGACRSTAVRRFNAGDYRGGCDAVTMWNKAGGRVLPGLVNRRAAEHKLCLEDL